jgi:hypothetical protein
MFNFFQFAVPIHTKDLTSLRLSLSDNQEIIGLVRIRNTTKFVRSFS